MRLFKALGSDVLRLSLNRHNCTESTPRFGIFVLLHGALGDMEGDVKEVEVAEGIVICRWNLFRVAINIGELFAYRKGFSVDGWLAKDGEIGDPIGL